MHASVQIRMTRILLLLMVQNLYCQAVQEHEAHHALAGLCLSWCSCFIPAGSDISTLHIAL